MFKLISLLLWCDLIGSHLSYTLIQTMLNSDGDSLPLALYGGPAGTFYCCLNSLT